MSLRTLHAMVWLAPAILLTVAVFNMPYGYYTFLRIAVFTASILLVFAEYQEGSTITAWAVALLGVAIAFNPLMPVHLSKGTWVYIDLGAAALFSVHLLISRRKIA